MSKLHKDIHVAESDDFDNYALVIKTKRDVSVVGYACINIEMVL